MGTEYVGVWEVVVVRETTVEDVRVTRAEAVAVMTGVARVAVMDGVKMAWRVSAAAVCTSLGGGTCSRLQARIERIRLIPASIGFNFWVINIYSFLLTAWGTVPIDCIIFMHTTCIEK